MVLDTERKMPAPKVKKPKKPAMKVVNTRGIRRLVDLAATMTVLKKIEGETEALIKRKMAKRFLRVGLITKKKPENLRAVEGVAGAVIEFKRSSAALTDDQANLLTANGVKFDTETTAHATHIINPEYLHNAEVIAKMVNALAKVKGLPEDLFKFQTEVSTKKVTDETLTGILSLEDTVVASSLLAFTTNIAVSQRKLGDQDDMADVYDRIGDYIHEAEEAGKE